MFRFTIRDVLWLTVVVGGFLAWWHERGEHVAFRNKFEALVAIVQNIGHEVRSGNPGTIEVINTKTNDRIQIRLPLEP